MRASRRSCGQTGPSPGSRRHTLLGPSVHLIGRERDRATVKNLVLHAPGRLVTLTGTGGCGKTQLALHVAAELVDAFRDGVCLIDLATTPSEALVPFTVATALGQRERAGQTLVDTIVTRLAPQQVLIVLDNCEHVINTCAELAERLLTGCPDVRLLVTSRERLRIGREKSWRVPSLAGPVVGPDLDHTALINYPAVRLFVERAQAVQPDFALAPGNARTIAEICVRLEGLPLALELAAARVSALGMLQILERLDDAFRLLVGGSRTAPTRQQTLRGTLDWSFGWLSAVERVVFARLAVFAGGWSLEAAEDVCSDEATIARTDVLELLTHLIDKSLVSVDELDGHARYRFLEPVRQYALESLRAAGDWCATRRRHAAFFRAYALAHERDASVGGSRRHAATQALIQEYANLRAALQWCIEAGEARVGLDIAWGLQFVWKSHGPFGEGVHWISRLLALPNGGEPTPARAVALITAGRLETLRGNRTEAWAFFADGVPLARRITDNWILWVALADSGWCALTRGDYVDAQTAFDEGLTVSRSARDPVAEAISWSNLGQLATYQANYVVGDRCSTEAVRLARNTGDQFALGGALTGAAWAALGLGNLAGARVFAEEIAAADDVLARVNAWEVLGLVALAEHRHYEAGAWLGDALRLRYENQSPFEIGQLLESLAALAAARNRISQALLLSGAAARIRETAGVPLHPMRSAWHTRWLAPLEQDGTAHANQDLLAEGRALSATQAVNLALTEAQLAIEAKPKPVVDIRAHPADLLTPRQQEVAALVAQGLTNRQIAERLVVTERAAASHIERILNKLGVSSRAQIAVWASERGLHTQRSS